MSKTELFPLGMLVITPAAQRVIPEQEVQAALARHAVGDWGDLDHDDWWVNQAALKEGGQLLSAYNAADGERFWIITDAGRDVTTVLLPSDY